MSKSIPLSQGKVALVDDAGFDRLNAHQRFVPGTGYAVGFVPSSDGKFQLIYMHRFIMQTAEGQLADHINGDSLDNRQTCVLRLRNRMAKISVSAPFRSPG
jgi:hypothetical protein